MDEVEQQRGFPGTGGTDNVNVASPCILVDADGAIVVTILSDAACTWSSRSWSRLADVSIVVRT